MPEETSQLTHLPSNLEDVKIKSLPNSSYYIADFISRAEEDHILNKIATAPKPRWKVLTHRRLQTWPSDLTKDTLIDAPLPSWLVEPIIPRLLSVQISPDEDRNIFSSSPHHAPNHVLINEYNPGQGIMPHKDGAAYHPVVCTISLGASLCLDIYGVKEDGTRESQPLSRIFQEPRSLLITTEKLYTDHMHGIADITVDANLNSETVANWSLLRSPNEIQNGTNNRQTRVSLTYRDVLKVSQLGNRLGLFGRR